MREIRTSGSMSGERKRSDAAWPKPPRLSSTLLRTRARNPGFFQNGRRMTVHFRPRRLWKSCVKYAIIPALDHIIREDTEWVCRGYFAFPVPPDPKHVCLRRGLHFGGFGNGNSARNTRQGSSHNRSSRGGHRSFGVRRLPLRSDLIPIPRR